jgi:hypothetical protein
MRKRKIAELGIVMLAALSATGCFWLVAGAAVGAGAYAYRGNRLEANKEVPVEKLHKASLAALEDLEMRLVRENVDKLTGSIEAETAQNKQVVININMVSETQSTLTIRVGTGFLGEEKNQASMIYNAIDKRLQ